MCRHWPIICRHWQPTQQGTRDTQGMAIQQPGRHCTPLFLALALAYEKKVAWHRIRIVVCEISRLNISQRPPLMARCAGFKAEFGWIQGPRAEGPFGKFTRETSAPWGARRCPPPLRLRARAPHRRPFKNAKPAYKPLSIVRAPNTKKIIMMS